jgi:hypothetical protein
LCISDGHSSASSKIAGSSFGGLPLVQSNDSLFGQPNIWNTGGQDTLQLGTAAGTFGQQQSSIGTTIKFNPPTGTDTMMTSSGQQSINTRHQCITLMREYENKSIEELRLEDYSANRKGTGVGVTNRGGSLFNAFQMPTSLFGEQPQLCLNTVKLVLIVCFKLLLLSNMTICLQLPV